MMQKRGDGWLKRELKRRWRHRHDSKRRRRVRQRSGVGWLQSSKREMLHEANPQALGTPDTYNNNNKPLDGDAADAT